MAWLRILAGQMRGALGSGNVAVRTVYVSPRVLGAASPAAASSAEVTRRALLSERSSAKYRANTKSKRFCSSHTRACLGVKGTRSSAPTAREPRLASAQGQKRQSCATPVKWAVARDRGSAKSPSGRAAATIEAARASVLQRLGCQRFQLGFPLTGHEVADLEHTVASCDHQHLLSLLYVEGVRAWEIANA